MELEGLGTVLVWKKPEVTFDISACVIYQKSSKMELKTTEKFNFVNY